LCGAQGLGESQKSKAATPHAASCDILRKLICSIIFLRCSATGTMLE
jgi:hypothetical protein